MKRVAAGIIVCNNKILIAQRKRGKDLEYFWEFPGWRGLDSLALPGPRPPHSRRPGGGCPERPQPPGPWAARRFRQSRPPVRHGLR